MNTQLKIKENIKINNFTNEQVLEETENIKNKTRDVGMRILKKCDETENIAELTKIMMDDQTKSAENIIENLNELDNHIKESKSLVKKLSNWFSIFQYSKKSTTEYIIKEEKVLNNSKLKLPQKKENVKYEFNSNDPAEEIAIKLEERLDKFALYAENYKNILEKQKPLLNTIDEKINKSDCDVKNVTKTIKKF